MKPVLIVDDSESVRQQVAETLTNAGYTIMEAHDGLAAHVMLQDHQEIGLVLCDVHMPRMGGIELLQNIKALISNRGLPVVMLTTDGNPALIRQAKGLGAKGWILKPFNPAQLISLTERLLNAQAPRSAPGPPRV